MVATATAIRLLFMTTRTTGCVVLRRQRLPHVNAFSIGKSAEHGALDEERLAPLVPRHKRWYERTTQSEHRTVPALLYREEWMK